MSFYLFNSWTLERCYPVPRPFLKLAVPDSIFPSPYPPDSFDYTGELKESDIIPYIEQKVREGKIIRIEFNGDTIEDPIALLYTYFQDANYIVIREPDFLNKKDLLKDYRILSRIKGSVFLIKNEKDSFI